MSTISFTDLAERLGAFASSRIAPRPELLKSDDFPFDLWEKLGDQKLMGLCIDPAYGGLGLDFIALSEATEVFAAHAACPGLVTSWLGHNLMGRLLVQNIGTEAQKEEWLPGIASGKTTVCVAISEPGAGAHPKFLKSTATLEGDQWIINAEKAFVTNGPIAGLFVLLAITGEKDGRKEFSAFLVPGGLDGISIRPMENPKIDFLKPSPHGLITFKSVAIPKDNILGPIGEGFEVVSRRVRHIEDAVGLGAMAGNLTAQLRLLAACLSPADRVDEDILEFFGQMIPRQKGLSMLAQSGAEDAAEDRGARAGGAAGALMAEAQRAIVGLVEAKGIKTSEHFDLFTRDMSKSGNIARTARQIQARKNGAAWLEMTLKD